MMIIQCALAFVWMCLLPFLTGAIFTKLICKKNMWNVFFLEAIGIMIHYAFYEVVALLFIKTDGSFRMLTGIYAVFSVICGLAGAVVLFLKRKELAAYFASRKEKKSGKKTDFYLMISLLLIAVQIGAILFMATPDKDDAFYSGLSSMSIAGDYVLKIDAYQGNMNKPVSIRYAISALPVYQASLSLLSGNLHHLFITHNLFPLFYMPLAYGLLCCIGKIFAGDDKEKEHSYLFFLTLLHLFGNYFVFSPQNFLVTRIWQGKALFVCLGIPFLYLLVREVYRAENRMETFLYWLMILAGMFGITFMGETGLYLGPLMLVALTLAHAIEKRRYLNFLWCFLAIVPQGLLVLLFLL